ncbi:alpha-ketoglutarate-dependent dioxygenase AlkB family protein [Saccharicrinis aurantiacus]|uniref:alpha-ketoglutarate-dependent dioxygenase AlkB family protein n=1 Tax=Saccharicrinis aurantiacus TaxID=1849719 RepID=UPI002491296B|nr:alpha-ketoglutarate-dependent dioxygenase AlkB [Saccharicrinis aurantiacus]
MEAEKSEKWVSINNGEYLYIPKFFTKIEGNELLKNLLEEIEWKQESKTMYGKETIAPKLSARCGDVNKSYSYNGETRHPQALSDSILSIKERIASVTDIDFNSVLLNQFRNEADSTYWQTDAANELGENPTNVYVNLGATRKFQFRHRDKKGSFDINLTHGSILITRGELQHFWVHQVAKSKKKVTPCVNLTFRRIL